MRCSLCYNFPQTGENEFARDPIKDSVTSIPTLTLVVFSAPILALAPDATFALAPAFTNKCFKQFIKIYLKV